MKTYKKSPFTFLQKNVDTFEMTTEGWERYKFQMQKFQRILWSG